MENKSAIIILFLVVILAICLVVNIKKANYIGYLKKSCGIEKMTDLDNMTVDKDNVQDMITKTPTENKLVLYHTNWCGHCKNFMPIWDEFTKQNTHDVLTDKVDCEQHRNICSEVGTVGFPTVMLFKTNGDKVEYVGPRTIDDLNEFLKIQLKQTGRYTTKEANILYPKSNNDTNTDKYAELVVYYTDWCGHSQNFLPVWRRFVNETKTGVRTREVNCETESDTCKNANVNGYPTVFLRKPNGDNLIFSGERTVQGLERFVRDNLG